MVDDLVELGTDLAGDDNHVVICGDLNARSEHLGNDHKTNARGRLLEEVLGGTRFRPQQPTEGRWTSFTRSGNGVPDLVLSTFRINNLVIHEDDSCGGSDHAPITFDIPDARPPKLDIRRWNVRRLEKPKVAAAYKQALEEDEELPAMARRCGEVEALAGRDELDTATLQSRIDDAAADLFEALARAARPTVGYLRCTPRTAKEFWTRDLELERDAMLASVAASRTAPLAGVQRAALFADARNRVREFRVNIERRRTNRFHTHFDQLGRVRTSASFLRSVKGMQKRKSRSGCALDPAHLPDHLEHFRSTWGGEPTGQAPMEPEGPAQFVPDLDLDDLVCRGTVRATLEKLPRGKAWGPDDIPAEFLQHGADALLPILTSLLHLVATTACIPTV